MEELELDIIKIDDGFKFLRYEVDGVDRKRYKHIDFLYRANKITSDIKTPEITFSTDAKPSLDITITLFTTNAYAVRPKVTTANVVSSETLIDYNGDVQKQSWAVKLTPRAMQILLSTITSKQLTDLTEMALAGNNKMEIIDFVRMCEDSKKKRKIDKRAWNVIVERDRIWKKEIEEERKPISIDEEE